MRQFHISDVLSITTGRLVSSRHIEGVYDILNFLTGDELYTHQLGRASQECEPWLRTQFPQLFGDTPAMILHLKTLDAMLKSDGPTIVGKWVSIVQKHYELPAMLPVYEMGADMHTRIDPEEELKAMVSDSKVISIQPFEGEAR